MKRNGMLILAQADHLTGEELGFAIEQIIGRGAENVYFFPGTTKKNRSGYVLLLDIDPEQRDEWARYLAEEFSIYGFHQILTSHYCSCCEIKRLSVVIRKGEASFETEMCCKVPKEGKGAVRVEHSDLVRVRSLVKEILKTDVSLSRLRMLFESLAEVNALKAGIIDL